MTALSSRGWVLWAKTKHKLLRDYIQASSGARSKHYSGRAYIDVFRGPARSVIRNSNEYIEGSPVAAFTQGSASRAAFSSIEISDASETCLDAATARLKALGAPVVATPGPAIDAMRQIVDGLDPGGLHFAFLDPHNLGALSFELLKLLARLERVDIIVHVSISDLRRNADRYTSEAHDQFDEFAGPGWRDAIDYRNMNSTTLRSEILGYWSDQVTKLGLTKAPHSEQIKGPGNQQLY
jgi:three-Cys-motif partner protein